MEKEFAPEFALEDFVSLGKYNIILKLMIDGLASKGFSAVTLAPITRPAVIYREDALMRSREQFTAKRADVEEYIRKWHEELATAGMPKVPSSRGYEGPKETAGPPARGPQGAMGPAASKLQATSSYGGAPASPAGWPASSRPAEPNLFEAVCSECGQRTVVPFRPDGTRPVYCKKCRKKHMGPKPGNLSPTVSRETEGPNIPISAPLSGKPDEARGKTQESEKPVLPKDIKKKVDITKVRDSLKDFIPPK